ncbi:EscV/YscV/HrcV family type III secretion system export apparatus protein [Yersinia ruckeri]|uniref:EscV/YscV/HrcV family type III secretion system export apparatus protein n=1 Tax=Yersinia ruckeri TaxID=29486 RepID=UPI001F2E98BE|nr:EscV/YscV/HrcV family type III secretion system export apparatus protein [Yersinia ruckeri]EKN4207446.1 EscV/YscV/HrcV family type III secretion system export apparatus protein [Yersinia ruckeri]EKN4706001.1 EscV/YscV/HrcV family type III secretion system export apparatus protein [Yersinia ruckeri]MCW6544901.1 EscV/YscV/HrcV family type III secretion system export apparatus protein [Yersinia ruckeri]MCW6572860.1 EscV/YscV/HrcV family type III secretion system export apparatus protein [Yersin
MNKITGLLLSLRNKPELMVLLVMVTVIAMLIVPLPTFLIDFLIGLNIMISVLIFMGSFYITKILNFKSFPSILLISTLFRLALSISTSRLILLEADAGDIIATFGQFVIQDNLVVGIVVFAIVTVVQFIVITKGSERIAEVAARFSLDAMPGKQMSIDADARSGIIDNDQVKIRRGELEQESQLFGSFDGAMKFIKGDAIAGIIIIFVNLIGGISVGVAQMGMDMSTALSSYTLLTIGDGLVAQIPALLISISAGFIVTRVGGNDKNLGENIVAELFDNDFSLLVTAIITCAIGFLPGFPTFIFLLLAGLLFSLYFYRFYQGKKGNKDSDHSTQERENIPNDAISGETTRVKNDIDNFIPETLPIIVSVSINHKESLESRDFSLRIKKDIFIKFGYRIPDVAINYSPTVDNNKIIILINEIPAGDFPIQFDSFKVVGAAEELDALGFDVTVVNDNNGSVSTWINQKDESKAKSLDVNLCDDITEMTNCISVLLLRHIHEFFGIQEAKNLLDDLEVKYPELLKECYRHATVQKITEVFQRLLVEKISIRNMKLILEALVQWAPKEKDPLMLVEHIRSTLSRYISDKFSIGNVIHVLMVGSNIEDTIRQSIRQSSGGTFLNLEPEKAENILQYFSVATSDLNISLRDITVLVPVDIRRFVKKILEGRYPDLEVISFNEISESVKINVIKTI